MDNSLKAALLSGLVFPGVGQFVLKRYRRGVVIIIIVLAGLAVVVWKAVNQASSILKQIELSGGPIKIEDISKAATQASSQPDSLLVTIVLSLIAVCWIFSVIDAYIIGKKSDLGKNKM